MTKRMIVSKLMILVLGLMSLPVSFAQVITQNSSIKFSAYQEDPFVQTPVLGKMKASNFERDENQRPFLYNSRVRIQDEDFIYRENRETHEFTTFAFNPWPVQPAANEKGNFNFQDEVRFPPFEIVRGADGKPILVDGLQVWKPIDCYLGMTTTFKAANADKEAAEFWAGRDINWGDFYNQNYVMFINSHSFIDFNAFYSPSARQIFLGLLPYRLPGETQIKMFETAACWEITAHECGHALHHTLKPNIDLSNPDYRTWSESFADQTAMWTSLRDKERARTLLEETGGNFHQSNALTRIAEAFAAIVGEGTAMRDAFHDKKVSDTSDEVHDRSEVLTGADYKLFETVYNGLHNQSTNDLDALETASEIMGIFLTRTTDYTPENTLTLEDVAKAYLKVDKEFYGSQYHDFLVNEFIARELFNESSEAEWMEHEAAVPRLKLSSRASDRAIDKLIQANLERLGIGPGFGLKLQSVTRDSRLKQIIVRVQLTDGSGSEEGLYENHGILVFRADGTLADYYSPLPEDVASQVQTQARARTLALVAQAKRFGIDQHGARLAVVRQTGGRLAVEARVMRSQGAYCWIEAFTLERPEGERREVIIPTIPHKLNGLQPSGIQILTADDLGN